MKTNKKRQKSEKSNRKFWIVTKSGKEEYKLTTRNKKVRN